MTPLSAWGGGVGVRQGEGRQPLVVLRTGCQISEFSSGACLVLLIIRASLQKVEPFSLQEHSAPAPTSAA